MNNEQANNNPQKANPATGNQASGHAQKLSAEIKKAFPKLNDADIALQSTSPDKFYEAVQTKQGINKAEAEKTVKKLDAECAAACSTNSAKDSNTASGPIAKPANDSSNPLPKAANS